MSNRTYRSYRSNLYKFMFLYKSTCLYSQDKKIPHFPQCETQWQFVCTRTNQELPYLSINIKKASKRKDKPQKT